MGMCPVCNGFERLNELCPDCGTFFDDCGRIMDYYDDYSAYMEIDHLKLEDGFPNTESKKQCPHLLVCTSCGKNKVVFVQE